MVSVTGLCKTLLTRKHSITEFTSVDTWWFLRPKRAITIYLNLTFTFLNQVRIAYYVIILSWSYMLSTLIPAFTIKHDGFLRLSGLPIVPDREWSNDQIKRYSRQWPWIICIQRPDKCTVPVLYSHVYQQAISRWYKSVLTPRWWGVWFSLAER
jgi:hypothetical protein